MVTGNDRLKLRPIDKKIRLLETFSHNLSVRHRDWKVASRQRFVCVGQIFSLQNLSVEFDDFFEVQEVRDIMHCFTTTTKDLPSKDFTRSLLLPVKLIRSVTFCAALAR